MSGRNRSQAQRRRLAYEATRIIVDQGVRGCGQGFDRARRKAAERAGIGDRRWWPKNEEIQEALLQQQRLFQGERQGNTLKELRRQALAAMDIFADFAPKLVGPVLSGGTDPTQGVRLHLSMLIILPRDPAQSTAGCNQWAVGAGGRAAEVTHLLGDAS